VESLERSPGRSRSREEDGHQEVVVRVDEVGHQEVVVRVDEVGHQEVVVRMMKLPAGK
jgi:hypothetical protein